MCHYVFYFSSFKIFFKAIYLTINIFHLCFSLGQVNSFMFIALNYLVWNYQFSDTILGRSQNLKQVPQNFMKTFNVDDVTLTSYLMISYRKINSASEKIINYKVTFPSNHHCFQINFVVRETPGISVVIHIFLFFKASR